MRKKILAIDIDGTLTPNIYILRKDVHRLPTEVRNAPNIVVIDEPKDVLKAKPWKEIIKKVNDRYDSGDWLIKISSGRRRKLKQFTIQWLKKVGVKYHKYGPKKTSYDEQWDDHSWRPEEIL
jgi:hypothetical protein